MAQCYSSGTPLNALANQLLGESSLSAKPSLFRPPQQQNQLQTHQAPFPRQPLPRQSLHRPRLPDPKHTDFEQAWSTSARVPNPTTSISHPYHPHSRLSEPFQFPQEPLFEHQRDLPDLDLIAAWEKANDGPSHLLQTTLSGTSMLPAPSLLTSEFESFHYQPEVHDLNPEVSQDGDWNKEWATHKANDDDDDDDDDDEFREEWSNDHFTQAYINTHRSKFQEIEEQERLKEARLEEERERLRQASGGPPRSAWMMAGAPSAATTATESIVVECTTTMQTGPRRLRVPGLNSMMEHPQTSSPTITLHVDEFMSITHQDPISLQPPQQSLPQKPIHTQDQFMSLVSDLHIAEQIYFPGATSTITPEALESDRPLSRFCQHAAPSSSLSSSSTENHNSWAREFVAEDRHQRQKHAGAEWNWEKLFGKDPRRQMELATEASKAAAAAVAKATGKSSAGEAERLKAVALTRLQALFGHLTLTPSPSAHPPASAQAP